MKIQAIHSFLVHPDKAAETQTIIAGTEVKGTGRLVEMLAGVFIAAPDECKHDILFVPNEAGEQQNDCLALILGYIAKPSKPNGLKLAKRLQLVTTHRSGLGLLFLMLGSNGKSKRLVISRFPADHGILADEHEDDLDVEFVERVFMKSATAYKSALYEGVADTHFWKGRAVDKQINSEVTVANYWIRDFLESDFAVTGAAGTRRFAIGLRSAIAAADSVAVKQELSSVAMLISNLDGKIMSVDEILDQFHMSASASSLVRQQFPSDKIFEESFKFVAGEFQLHIAYRSVELNNGALLTAPATQFDKVFSQEQQVGQGIRFSTTGEVIDDKLRKTKS